MKFIERFGLSCLLAVGVYGIHRPLQELIQLSSDLTTELLFGVFLLMYVALRVANSLISAIREKL
ncbi:MAG: hypothetical protein AAB375_02975 [Patescibacteria group bacterium]